MCRETIWTVYTCCSLFILLMPAPAQVPPFKDWGPVRQVTKDDLETASNAKGKVVIGSLAADDHNGHVVVVVPGRMNVWDGNTLGGLKDLVAGKSVSNESVLNRMESFVNRQYPADIENVQKTKPQGLKNATAEEKKAYFDKVTDFFSNASKEDKQKYLDSYIKNGASLNDSWNPTDRAKVKWYQVQTDQKVKDIIKHFSSTQPQNLRCNDLVQQVAPVMKDLVKKEVGERAFVTANNIDKALSLRSEKTTQPVQKLGLDGIMVNPRMTNTSSSQSSPKGVRMPLDLDANGVQRESSATNPKKDVPK